MIVSPGLPWTRLPHFIAREVVYFALFDIAVVIAYAYLGITQIALPELPLSLVGAAISVFLGFRIKAAYDRWWEARMLWGALVNTSRTITRRALILTGDQSADQPDKEERFAYQKKITYFQVAYVHALRAHLRKQNPLEELRTWLSDEEVGALSHVKNVPAKILLMMGELIREAYTRGWLDTFRFVAMEESLTNLTDIQGGCERIKNTPLPRQYHSFPHLFICMYGLLLPLGLVDKLGIWTPVASTFTAVILLALDSAGRNIENPFENTVHDTPMTALARTIEIDLRQHIGETSVPAPIEPVEGYLF